MPDLAASAVLSKRGTTLGHSTTKTHDHTPHTATLCMW